jgi:hypothetical protein
VTLDIEESAYTLWTGSLRHLHRDDSETKVLAAIGDAGPGEFFKQTLELLIGPLSARTGDPDFGRRLLTVTQMADDALEYDKLRLRSISRFAVDRALQVNSALTRASLNLMEQVNSFVNEGLLSTKIGLELFTRLCGLIVWSALKEIEIEIRREKLTFDERLQQREILWTIASATASGKFVKHVDFGLNLTLSFAINVIDGETRLSDNYPDFIDVLRRVDLARIRTCQFCNNIFWAHRKDSSSCSERCARNQRQKEFRSERRIELNKKRRANYAYKKKMKRREK